MKKKKRVPKGATVYLVHSGRFEATWMEICSSRPAADKLIENLCKRWDFLYPDYFFIRPMQVK